MSEKKSALIAMSGGVDSSVAAYLMQQRGFRCDGTTMRLYRNADIGLSQFHSCCSQRDIDDASEVAFQLDIPYEWIFPMKFWILPWISRAVSWRNLSEPMRRAGRRTPVSTETGT